MINKIKYLDKLEANSVLNWLLDTVEKQESREEKIARKLNCTVENIVKFVNLFTIVRDNVERDGIDIEAYDLDFVLADENNLNTLYKNLFDLFTAVCIEYANEQDDMYFSPEFNFNYLLDGSNSKLDDGGAYNIEMSPEEVYQVYISQE